jgi:hypothetical protein
MIYNDYLPGTFDTIHTLEPARPSLLVHPSKNDLPRPMRRYMLSGSSPTPLASEPADGLDDLIAFYSGRRNRNQNNKWPALRFHDVLERFLAKLHS